MRSAFFTGFGCVLVAGLFLALSQPAGAAEEKKPLEPPTPAVAKKVLEDYYRKQWSKDWGNAKVEKLTVDVSEPKLGQMVEKQMGRGELARPVFPVKAEVKISVKYVGNDKVGEHTFGAGDGDAYFFYKDAFGEWTFRTGTL